MQPHPLREVIADHSCKNCRYPERGCARYLRLETCQEFQPNDDATYREIVRLRIAHLRRMADTAASWGILSIRTDEESYKLSPRCIQRLLRFHATCLAKIAELKESQCSTKS